MHEEQMMEARNLWQEALNATNHWMDLKTDDELLKSGWMFNAIKNSSDWMNKVYSTMQSVVQSRIA